MGYLSCSGVSDRASLYLRCARRRWSRACLQLFQGLLQVGDLHFLAAKFCIGLLLELNRRYDNLKRRQENCKHTCNGTADAEPKYDLACSFSDTSGTTRVKGYAGYAA